MNERDRDSLEDLRDAARKVLHFSAGPNEVALAGNEEKLSAVLYQFVVVGEAARRLFDDFRQAHAEVPWRQIIAAD
ncbi:MAG: hypothetical protein EB034_23845, partial [Verrucomicrobia bacterium]|nr:hypothetical protein [Verrucomicrobiota bacterium]